VSATDVDVVIVGGGLVGASMASALDGLGLRIALIEAVPPRTPGQPSYDDRTLALSLASARIFQAIGLWPGVADGVTPIREVQVSQRGHFGAVRIRARDMNVRDLGYVVEGRVIGEAVSSRLPALSDVEVHCPARIGDLVLRRDRVELSVEREGESAMALSTRLVIGADGTNSFLRRHLDLECVEYDYRQTAVIANVTPAEDHRNRAFERFGASGPLAFLPHVGRRCGVVWTSPTADAEAVMALDDEAFLAAVQRRFGYRLGRLEKVGRRSAYPLRYLYAERQIEGRCVIIGNAAHTVHNVSAQGFNLGLRDVAVLAERIVAALHDGGDPGDDAMLARYQAQRRRDHRRIMAYTDALARGFTQPFLPVRLARSAGLVATQLVPGLRAALARRTMGFGGDVPRLARGLPLVEDSDSGAAA